MKKTDIKKKKTFALLFSELKDNKLYLAIFLIAFIAGNVLEFIAAFKTAELLGSTTAGDVSSIKYLFGLITLIIVVGYLTNIIVTLATNKITTRSGDKVRLQLLDRLFVISSQSFSNVKTGPIVNRVASGARRLMASFLAILNQILYFFTSINIIVYVLIQDWSIGLILVGICIFLFVGYFLFCKFVLYKLEKVVVDKSEKLNSIVNEMVKSEKDIKSLNLESEIEKVAKNSFCEEVEADKKYGLIASVFYFVMRTIGYSLLFGFTIIAFFALKNTTITVVLFLLIWGNALPIINYTISFAKNCANYQKLKVLCEKINEIFDTDKFKLEHFGNENFDSEFKGNVTFKNVCFAYDDDKEKNVINNMSFEIPSGKSVAFVGLSGSGKSTLISLISKLYDAKSGEILLDNKNINCLSKEAIRGNLALVNQFPYIFDASIKENLHFANANATEEDIWKVLEMANLKEFVEELPDKLDTVLGENGIKLSGGQKQRLAIARAFLKQSKVIIFDESTSSLDNFAQGVVQKSIESLHGEKTIIIVAHRLSTIKNVDTIFFVEKGAIRSSGSFDYLFKNDEKFKALFMAENINE